jgi:hypothetical protein
MTFGRAAPRLSWLVLTGAIYAFGIAIRIAWAESMGPWTTAPDHLAWGLLLREAIEGPVRADQLFHFPHEGRSFVDGAIAFVIARRWAIDPAEALAWAALAIDSVGRAIETVLVAALFGARVALGFTAWSAAGNLLLIENATAAYGGHLALSPWPVVALAILLRPPLTRAGAVAAGSALGVSAAMGNQDVLLVGVVLALLGPAGRSVALAAIGVAAALLFVRAQLDLGFHLLGFDWWNIRGVGIDAEGIDDVARSIGLVLVELLPASFALGAGTVALAAVVLWLGLGIVVLRSATTARFVALVVGLFALAYALLFASEIPNRPFDAVDLRHFAWLAPMLAAVAIAGWQRLGRWGWTTVLLPLAATAGALGDTPTRPSTTDAAWSGAGFTLAEKLGDDPRRLHALSRWVPPDRTADFWSGVGTGLGQVALQDGDVAQRAVALVESFALDRRPEIAEGVEQWLGEADPPSRARFTAAVWSARVSSAGLIAPFPRSALLLFGVGSLVLPEEADATRLTVLASGTRADGVEPTLELWVDGGLAKALPIGEEMRAYDLGPLPPHAHVELRYANDLVDADGNDRNLVIHWIDRHAAPAAPHP